MRAFDAGPGVSLALTRPANLNHGSAVKAESKNPQQFRSKQRGIPLQGRVTLKLPKSGGQGTARPICRSAGGGFSGDKDVPTFALAG